MNNSFGSGEKIKYEDIVYTYGGLRPLVEDQTEDVYDSSRKYEITGEKKNGIYLGKLLGLELRNTVFGSCDYIIPVPLHPKKLRKRGYNQASVIAEGVKSIIHKPIIEDFLIRKKYSGTQTRKNRFERFLNMESIFMLNPDYRTFENYNLLLIDDVVTTGSTLEACSEAIIMEIQGSIYAATVAYA